MYLINEKHKSMQPISSDMTSLCLLVLILLLFLVPIPFELRTPMNAVQKHPVYILISQLIYFCIMAATGGIILIHSKTKRSIAKRFLSSQFLYALNQASFGIYLVNPLLIWYNLHLARQASELNAIFTAQSMMFIYAESLAVAMFLYVCFEMPFRRLSLGVRQYFLRKASESSPTLPSLVSNGHNGSDSSEIKLSKMSF